ncbi:hypothetical protein EDD80_10759 [Anseongella ginsenosidimutans]|uniref:Uncharacterized protein n=1 Tax=Anseongella ginsenosidimutans TaxID=496056 RepID=A0A4V2UTK1_9SPHI|nr:hypothetical protein [Anseongella ginsenosidimutans]QEC52604.1 hypothetical protein FRZ59_09830 [Anseongella ginsenosidimutans]TCS86526.1 hypothetical protein EDD80_10759 [Anseongella ginsenosidimutans]
MTQILRYICLPAVFLAVTACKKDFLWNLEGMEPVSADWMFRDLKLPETYDYIELRMSYGPWEAMYHVQDSLGLKCDETIPDCFTRFDTLRTYRHSFHQGCLPGYCDHYLVTRQGNTIRTWVGLDELSSFLGPVDDSGDALLWVYANGYYFEAGNSRNSGVKRLNDDIFYMIALRMVKDCMPVQTDRFLLEVHRSGEIKILAQALHHQSGGCI